jgi:fused signal recognition particle receptor
LLLVLVAGITVRARRTRVADRPGPPGRPPAGARPSVAAPSPVSAPERTDGIGGRIQALFRRGVTEDTWRGLEETLIRADVGPRAAAAIVARVRERYQAPDDPTEVVSEEIRRTFDGDPRWSPPNGSPGVVMVVGVNGTGKTTTIGKLAHMLGSQGLTVSLAASDTFRAAAGEQLETWATRTGAYLVAQARGADPGAVAFDAIRAAEARGSDVLIVDTAGRLHTKQPLMEELRKVRRVLEKAAQRQPDEVLLVLDATTGQNGITQARAFTEAVDVSGVVLAKMDGTARGGIVVAVREELGIPVKLVGTGEGVGDLQPFDPSAFARQLVR